MAYRHLSKVVYCLGTGQWTGRNWRSVRLRCRKKALCCLIGGADSGREGSAALLPIWAQPSIPYMAGMSINPCIAVCAKGCMNGAAAGFTRGGGRGARPVTSTE